MEQNDTSGGFSLIGYDDLVVESEIPGFKQVQLQRAFTLLFDFLPDKEKTVTRVSRLGFPRSFKVRPLAVDFAPTFSTFDHFLELGQPFEGNRSGESHILAAEC